MSDAIRSDQRRGYCECGHHRGKHGPTASDPEHLLDEWGPCTQCDCTGYEFATTEPDGDAEFRRTTPDSRETPAPRTSAMTSGASLARTSTAGDAVLLEAARLIEEEAGTVAVCLYCDRQAAWKSDERKAAMRAIVAQLRERSERQKEPQPAPPSGAPTPTRDEMDFQIVGEEVRVFRGDWDKLVAGLAEARAECDALRDKNDALRDELAESVHVTQLAALREDAARLDWLEGVLTGAGHLRVTEWDHDGRRIIYEDDEPVLLVHKFAERGGTDESLRAAIDAARTGSQRSGRSHDAVSPKAPSDGGGE